ncbi:MAG TPA: hypothetical protein VEJ18_22075, partial [Planctomycetota bacterium]|nr:hypothetical protein [Planctomycetota bacterium]
MKGRTGCAIGLGTGILVLWALSTLFIGHCVLEGELVDTPEGPRPIESLEVGDPVWTWGPAGREPGEILHRTESTANAWLVL